MTEFTSLDRHERDELYERAKKALIASADIKLFQNKAREVLAASKEERMLSDDLL